MQLSWLDAGALGKQGEAVPVHQLEGGTKIKRQSVAKFNS